MLRKKRGLVTLDSQTERIVISTLGQEKLGRILSLGKRLKVQNSSQKFVTFRELSDRRTTDANYDSIPSACL